MTPFFDNVQFPDTDQGRMQCAGYKAKNQLERDKFRSEHSDWCKEPPSSDHDNGPGTQDTPHRQRLLAACSIYERHGLTPIVLKPREKKPAGAWEKCTVAPGRANEQFDQSSNIGIRLGSHSNDLVDIDLDCQEARVIADLLMGTLPAFGRGSAPRSHRLIRCKGAKSRSFNLPASGGKGEHGAKLLEIRSTKSYTMFPPSVHPSGEIVEWSGGGLTDPRSLETVADVARLELTAGIVAFAAAMIRFYPDKGVRDEFCLALAGAFARVTNSAEEIDKMVLAIGNAAGGGKSHHKTHGAESVAKVAAGEEVTGLPRICEMLGLGDDYLRTFRKWLSLAREEEKGPGTKDPDDARPEIAFEEENLTKMLTFAQSTMLAAGCQIFQRSGRIVEAYRLQADEGDKETDVARKSGSLVIGEMTQNQIQVHMTDHGRYLHWDGRAKKWRPGAPKLWFCETFLTWNRGWRLPVLHGTSEVPLLRQDGSLCCTEGYDSDSGVLVDFGGVTFPSIPERPTKAESHAALGKLKHLLRGFPFVDKASLSVALSLCISAPVVRTLPAVPLHLFDAPQAGTGKSLLVGAAAIIATGREAPVTTLTESPDENEKRIVSSLKRGDLILALDNVSIPIGGDVLCSAVTEPEISPRLLGGNIKEPVPTNVLFTGTGNNVKVKGDMVRRTIKCRMDACVEHPEERTFDFDVKAEAREQRPELVAAILTVLRGWICAVEDDRQRLTAYGSFDAWSYLVRGALVWLGETDPCDSRQSLRDDDPVTAGLLSMVTAWRCCLKVGEWYGLEKLIEIAGKDRANDALDAAIRAACSGPKGVTTLSLGKWLSGYVDRVVSADDHRLRFRKRMNPVTRGNEYRLEKLPEQEALL